ncbi:MAG: hypothetical protein WCG92_15005 [Hyphomicrobiales bacterium]
MHPLRTALIALVLSASAMGPVFGITSVNVFGLKAPEEIDGFTLNDSTNFEKIRPGDGYGLDYSKSGWKLDVFIYDLKRAAIPDDAKSAIVRAEVERGRADAFLAQPRGLYSQVYLRRNFTVEDGSKRTRFQCAAFHLTREGAKPQDGFFCVTAWNNKFVKFRLTTLSDSQTEATARKFVASWIPVLWGPGGGPAVSRAEAARPEPRAQAHPRAARPQPVRRVPARPRFKCPDGYICETR